MRKYVLIGLLAMAVMLTPGCTQPDKAKRVVEGAGYSNVVVTGWRPMMAGEDDTFSTGFRAVDQRGKVVTGAVCGGWLKGSTIRLD
jgi:hypothetical protein